MREVDLSNMDVREYQTNSLDGLLLIKTNVVVSLLRDPKFFYLFLLLLLLLFDWVSFICACSDGSYQDHILVNHPGINVVVQGNLSGNLKITGISASSALQC